MREMETSDYISIAAVIIAILSFIYSIIQYKNIKSEKHYGYLDELADLLRNYNDLNFNIDLLNEQINKVKTITIVKSSLNPIIDDLKFFKNPIVKNINTYQKIYENDLSGDTKRSIREIHRLKHHINSFNKDYEKLFIGFETIVNNYNKCLIGINSSLADHRFTIRK